MMFCCALSVLLPKNANTRGSNKGDAPLLSVLFIISEASFWLHIAAQLGSGVSLGDQPDQMLKHSL